MKDIQRIVTGEVGRILKSNRWYWEHSQGKAKMNPKIKAALIALCTALAEDDDTITPAAPDEAKAKKAAEAAAKKAEAEAKKAAEAAAKKGTPDLLAKAREVVTKFGEAHGREATRTKLDEFTKGTVADVPADKLDALIKAFSPPAADDRPLV